MEQPRRKFGLTRRIILLIFVVALGLGVNALLAHKGITADEDLVVVAVKPQTEKVHTGETFTLKVIIRAGDRQVDGAQIFLDFDPKVLQVLEVTLLPPLHTPIYNQVDNENGRVSYAAGLLLGTLPSGTFDLVEMTLQAQAPTGGTYLTFTHDIPRRTAVSLQGYLLPLRTEDGRVIVTSSATSPTPNTWPRVLLPLILREYR